MMQNLGALPILTHKAEQCCCWSTSWEGTSQILARLVQCSNLKKKPMLCFWKAARAMINNPLVLIVPIQNFPAAHFSPSTSLSCKHFPLLLLIQDINELFKHTRRSAFYQTFWDINTFKAGSWLCGTVTITFLS